MLVLDYGIELARELRESRSDLKYIFMTVGREFKKFSLKKLSKYVAKWFAKNNVTVVPNSNINKVEPGKIYNGDEPKDIGFSCMDSRNSTC